MLYFYSIKTGPQNSRKIAIISRLSCLIKTNDFKFLTFDQAIEKVLDKIDLESRLEKLIKSVVSLDKKRTSLTETLTEENVYFSLGDSGAIKRFRTPELLFLEHVFCLIKFAKLSLIIDVYKNLFGTFQEKLEGLIKSNPNKLVINTGSKFSFS